MVTVSELFGKAVMFPSSLKSPSLPRRSDSLNATQQKSSIQPIFLAIEQELHDARRVQTHGQEDDLRGALGMVINRVGELSSMLADAYKSQVDLETQLNLAKSNLKLVIANNEMLEEALRHGNGNSKDVGWRRRSGRDSSMTPEQGYRHSVDFPVPSSASTTESNPDFPPTSSTRPASPAPSQSENSRFFKFRFTSNNATPPINHLTSPSLPSLATHSHLKELEEATAELEKERVKCKKALEDKASLEAEIESLSQALFEEANKMVATERIKRAETEEELREAVLEKEALRSALKLIEGENTHLRSNSTPSGSSPIIPPSLRPITRSRSSSEVAIKSQPGSPTTTKLPDSPQIVDDSPDTPTTPASALPSDSEPTPQYATHRQSQQYIGLSEAPDSPWADVASASPRIERTESSLMSAAALYAMR
ncbi:GDP/GTP exchange factor Sec2 N-terminal domain-containing protein [Pleurotus pulmonarius]